ncbi:MAG: lysyl oxidase family protein [Candidatus Rokuibacteriota bacterium]
MTSFLFAPAGYAQQVSELKPNLQPRPAFGFALVPNGLGDSVRPPCPFAWCLIFSTTSWNGGDGPLELHAGEIDTGSSRQNVYQRVYLSDGGFYDRLAGTFVWHPAHNHFHFEDYAIYTLQPVNAPGGSQRIGSKTTFCIIDTTPINTSLPGAPPTPVYTTCGPAIQGMSVGWGDTYGRQLAGQLVDFTDNPSGDYKLTIEIDPKKRLIETNDGDNISCVLLRINAVNKTVTVLDPTGCNPAATVTGIQPNTAERGTVTAVTITGSGFAPGMQVSFENGSGPRPTASNLFVHDATTITANVTVKTKGGGKGDAVWDVRVGPAVRPDAFTVVP